MAELLADPGFDLIYGHLGSVFIPRDDAPTVPAEIQRMVDGAEPGSAFVIFPEGRLFSVAARDRSLARLVESARHRASSSSVSSTFCRHGPVVCSRCLTLCHALM